MDEPVGIKQEQTFALGSSRTETFSRLKTHYLTSFFLFIKFSHASALPDLGLDRNQKINTEIP